MHKKVKMFQLISDLLTKKKLCTINLSINLTEFSHFADFSQIPSWWSVVHVSFQVIFLCIKGTKSMMLLIIL